MPKKTYVSFHEFLKGLDRNQDLAWGRLSDWLERAARKKDSENMGEIVQNARIRLMMFGAKRLFSDSFQKDAQFWAYVGAVVASASIDIWKEQDKNPVQPGSRELENSTMDEEGENHETINMGFYQRERSEESASEKRAEMFQVYISELPEKHRKALTLRSEGKSYKEIALALGSNANTVATWIKRGKTRLAELASGIEIETEEAARNPEDWLKKETPTVVSNDLRWAFNRIREASSDDPDLQSVLNLYLAPANFSPQEISHHHNMPMDRVMQYQQMIEACGAELCKEGHISPESLGLDYLKMEKIKKKTRKNKKKK